MIVAERFVLVASLVTFPEHLRVAILRNYPLLGAAPRDVQDRTRLYYTGAVWSTDVRRAKRYDFHIASGMSYREAFIGALGPRAVGAYELLPEELALLELSEVE